MVEEQKLIDENNRRDKIELTKTEILKAMNDVSEDLEFTMELQSDFKTTSYPLCRSHYTLVNLVLVTRISKKNMKNQTL